MKRLLTATLFTFLTIYSSLAGVVVELHLVDHHNNHEHNDQHHIHDEHHQEENLIEHLVLHTNHDKETNHAHEKQPEYVLSTQKDFQSLFSRPKLIFLPISFNPSFINHSPQDLGAVSFSKTLAYSPPPNRFRNLPLLN